MSFLSLLLVFLLEQFRPLAYEKAFSRPMVWVADLVERSFNAGNYLHGVLAWLVVVGSGLLLAGGAYYLLYAINPLLGLALNVLVLYLTLGFRRFSSHYTEIQNALRQNDLPAARQSLAAWQGLPVSAAGASDIARIAIEQALQASHRHVFAVMFWFALLPGPSGAVLYPVSVLLAERWGRSRSTNDFSLFSQQVLAVLEWPAARVTALVFAVVGNFEDALYCWRTQAGQWADAALGIVLASGAGALGVRLGIPGEELDGAGESCDLGLGEPADVDFMQSAVGLVWRATVFWMLLLFLLGLASLVS